MSKTACALALVTLCAASPAAAQRWASPVTEMTPGLLSSQLNQQRPRVARCASSEDSRAYLVELRANVQRGARPSSMHNARIAVNVVSRPRDGAFEACVRRQVRDALRHTAYSVSRRVRANVTFRLNERPTPRPRPPAPSYSQAEVRRVLRYADSRFQRCLGVAGLPERVSLRLAVDADGRFTLMNASVPPGADRGAVQCLSRVANGLRVRGAPPRRVELSHTVAVRGRAY